MKSIFGRGYRKLISSDYEVRGPILIQYIAILIKYSITANLSTIHGGKFVSKICYNLTNTFQYTTEIAELDRSLAVVKNVEISFGRSSCDEPQQLQ